MIRHPASAIRLRLSSASLPSYAPGFAHRPTHPPGSRPAIELLSNMDGPPCHVYTLSGAPPWGAYNL